MQREFFNAIRKRVPVMKFGGLAKSSPLLYKCHRGLKFGKRQQDNNAKFSDEESSEVKDPSNLELKEMLVDIKIELSNIERENNKFAKEIAELRNLIQEQKTEIDNLKTSIKKTENKNMY